LANQTNRYQKQKDSLIKFHGYNQPIWRLKLIINKVTNPTQKIKRLNNRIAIILATLLLNLDFIKITKTTIKAKN
jgi:hypothetical protein